MMPQARWLFGPVPDERCRASSRNIIKVRVSEWVVRHERVRVWVTGESVESLDQLSNSATIAEEYFDLLIEFIAEQIPGLDRFTAVKLCPLKLSARAEAKAKMTTPTDMTLDQQYCHSFIHKLPVRRESRRPPVVVKKQGDHTWGLFPCDSRFTLSGRYRGTAIWCRT